MVLTETGKTPLSFQKAQVVRVAAEPSALDEYLARRDKAPATAAGQYELGLWCEEHKLPDLAEVHYEAAVAKDKAFAPAHQKLGHVLVGDRWLTGDELREAQGLVKYKGRWVPKEERDRREAAAAAGAEQASWARRIRLLRQAIVAGPEDRRREAEEQLAEIRDPIAVAPLVRVLGDDTPDLRTMLDHVLGAIPGPEAASALVVRMLDEADPEVRHATLAELGRRTEPNVVPGLVRALRSSNPAVVNRAAWTLAQLGAVAAVPQLVPALITTQYRVVLDDGGGAAAGGYVSTPPSPVAGGAPVAYNGSSIGLPDRPGDRPPGRSPSAPARCRTPTRPIRPATVTYGNASGSSGPEPKVVTYSYQNVEVLHALVKLTGRDFGFDIPAWRRWVSTSFRADAAPARRVPQPEWASGGWGVEGRGVKTNEMELRLPTPHPPLPSSPLERGDRGGRVRRADRRAAPAEGAGAGDADRPPEPPPVPAAALPGGDGGAEPERHRLADPPHPPRPAERRGRCWPRPGDRRGRRGRSSWTTGSIAVRLPDRGDGGDALVLRARRVGARTRRG